MPNRFYKSIKEMGEDLFLLEAAKKDSFKTIIYSYNLFC